MRVVPSHQTIAKIMKRALSLASLFLFAVLAGCEGAEGPIGPIGPQGPEGPRGPTGEDGIHCWDLDGDGVGDPGEDVNGNGEFTAEDCHGEISIQATIYTWTLEASDFEGGFLEQIPKPAPAITDDVLANGTVLGFTSGNGGDRWIALPFVLSSSGYAIVMSYAFEISTFIVQITDDGEDAGSFYNGQLVRAVILPSGAGKVGVDLTDYEAVAAYYGLD